MKAQNNNNKREVDMIEYVFEDEYVLEMDRDSKEIFVLYYVSNLVFN